MTSLIKALISHLSSSSYHCPEKHKIKFKELLLKSNSNRAIIGKLSEDKSPIINIIKASELNQSKFKVNDKESIIILSECENNNDNKININNKNITFITSTQSKNEILIQLVYILQKHMQSNIQHGVMLDYLNLGVLIRGASGIGKSELALNLIQRQARLVADDVVILMPQNDGELYACCPELLQNYLHIRDLGILNICQLYGQQAITPLTKLELIIDLSNTHNENKDPLIFIDHHKSIFDHKIPVLKIQNVTQRKLETLVDAAIRNHKLNQSGNNATLDIQLKQRRKINS